MEVALMGILHWDSGGGSVHVASAKECGTGISHEKSWIIFIKKFNP